jgi:pimeloyl-ACP methyl ester carboxylesterase
MTLLGGILLVLGVGAGVATGMTAWLARRIARRHPPLGEFMIANGCRLHAVHRTARGGSDLPPLVFIHGASGNLRDSMVPLAPVFEGRAEMLFFDRPGHGWSERGPATNATPFGQADTLAALMDTLGIGRAVIVGHSFGGAIAAAFAVRHPDKVAGLVFLAAASHPWPGGDTSWYYRLTTRPLLGPLFARMLALPVGLWMMPQSTACVFSPNPVPEGYLHAAGIPLLLRPATFRANAEDVQGLYAHTLAAAPHYRAIAAPTLVITGDHDTVVYEEVHSHGLARDIPGARLLTVHNLGHKPDWIAPDLVVAAVETVAGLPVDIEAAARTVEARIAEDAFGPLWRCPDPKYPPELLAQIPESPSAPI